MVFSYQEPGDEKVTDYYTLKFSWRLAYLVCDPVCPAMLYQQILSPHSLENALGLWKLVPRHVL